MSHGGDRADAGFATSLGFRRGATRPLAGPAQTLALHVTARTPGAFADSIEALNAGGLSGPDQQLLVRVVADRALTDVCVEDATREAVARVAALLELRDCDPWLVGGSELDERILVELDRRPLTQGWLARVAADVTHRDIADAVLLMAEPALLGLTELPVGPERDTLRGRLTVWVAEGAHADALPVSAGRDRANRAPDGRQAG